MKKIFCSLSSCFLLLIACSQQDTATGFSARVTDHSFSLGQTSLTVRYTAFETKPSFLLLQLHSNEETAKEVATALAYREGLGFIQVLNNQDRLVSFSLEGKLYQFDPNRIFSQEGIKKTLQLSGRYSDRAYDLTKQFSDSLLSLMPQTIPVVAVHNNTDGRFTVLQYRDAGIGQVYVNPTHDEDDFFITTDEDVFHLLKSEDFNVVLENAREMEDDGSLSLYCSRMGIRYINIEAQHGHHGEQQAMLEAVIRILKQRKKHF